MNSDLFHYIFAVAVVAAITIMEATGHAQADVVNTMLGLLAVQVGYRLKGDNTNAKP